MSSDAEANPLADGEIVETFATYGEAAKAACLFVKPPPPEQKLKFYISRLGPAKGKRVGVGLDGTSTVLDLVRLDNDSDKSGKGIHFNARRSAGSREKLAAIVGPTVKMTEADRQKLYFEWLEPLQEIAAPVTLWNQWRAGRQPRAMEGELDEGEQGAGDGNPPDE